MAIQALFLAPFIRAITGTIGWASRVVLPGLLTGFFAHLLVRIGLVVVYFVATTSAVNFLLNLVESNLGSLPGDVISLMKLTGLLNAMNIIASAYLFKLTLKIDAVKLLASKT